MERFNTTAVIWEEEGTYVSKCPELGVASCGDTPEEALDNLKEAVELYIDNAIELGIQDFECHCERSEAIPFRDCFVANAPRNNAKI